LDLSLIKSGDCEEFNLNDASLKPTEVRTIILGGCNFQDKIVDDVFEFTFNIDYGSSSGASHSGSGLIKAPVSDDHIKELTMASNEIIDVCAKAEILTRETSYNLCTQLATSEPAKFALCCPQQVGERCAANPRPDDCYCC
jgi:hypothetical protein